MLKPTLTGVSLVIAALAATAAQARELTGPQITSLVSGATVEIDAPTGAKIPVRYSQEGRISGEARELAWYLGSATDSGRWWISGDELCHKWLRWFNGEQQCMRIARDGGRAVRWTGKDGTTGTATITIPATAVAQATTLPSFGSGFARRYADPPAGEIQPPPARLDGPPPAPQRHAAAPIEAPARAAPDAKPDPEPVREPPAAAPPRAHVAPARTAVAALVPPAPRPAERADTAPRTPESARTSSLPPAPTVAPMPSPPPRFKVANVRADDVLNVRSGPSADHDIVGMLAPGSRGIAVTSPCQAQWCPVQRDGTAGWVNSAYLVPEVMPVALTSAAPTAVPTPGALHDSLEAPRACLTPAARALLGRIEGNFGPVQVISTCRSGAVIAGTRHPSRHASGNAIDFKAGTRKAAILEWLIANHRAGGVMTYAGMDHIHVDIGPRFISIAGGRHWSSWRDGRRD
jgi:hypothetical protein